MTINTLEELKNCNDEKVIKEFADKGIHYPKPNQKDKDREFKERIDI